MSFCIRSFILGCLTFLCCGCDESDPETQVDTSPIEDADIRALDAWVSDGLMTAADTALSVDSGLEQGMDAFMDMETETLQEDASVEPAVCTINGCGGEVVGSWTLQGICQGGYTSMEPVLDSCDVPATQTVGIGASGGVDFFDDGTYRSVTVLELSFALSIPGRCAIGLASCAGIEFNFQNSEETQDWTCTQQNNADPCICSGQRTETETVSGTYTADGTVLTITPLDVVSDSPNRSAELKGGFEYCADEAGLRLIRAADDDIPAVLTLAYGRNETVQVDTP